MSPEFLSCPTHTLQNKKKKKSNPSKTPSLLTNRDFITNKKNKKLLQINPVSVLLNTLGELKFKPVLFSGRVAANTCT